MHTPEKRPGLQTRRRLQFVCALALCLVTAACRHGPEMPVPEILSRIQREPYVRHANDCSNKSAKLCRILLELDYDAALLVVEIPDLRTGVGMQHAVVRCDLGDGPVYYDVVNNAAYRRLPRSWTVIDHVMPDRLYTDPEFVNPHLPSRTVPYSGRESE